MYYKQLKIVEKNILANKLYSFVFINKEVFEGYSNRRS